LNWTELKTDLELDQLFVDSTIHAVMVFKHSTRCSISSVAKSRLERDWLETDIKPFFLDLIKYRELSNRLALELSIRHESPQILLIKDQKCIFNASHLAINYHDVLEATKIQMNSK
jgi:bacillithiol system protein YtxJ